MNLRPDGSPAQSGDIGIVKDGVLGYAPNPSESLIDVRGDTMTIHLNLVRDRTPNGMTLIFRPDGSWMFDATDTEKEPG